MLSLLGCGEEAACLSFDRLQRMAPAAHDALAAVARDERVHDALLRGLLARLPPAGPNSRALVAMRSVHKGLGQGDPGLQCAGIAALDSAVCTLLSGMLRRGTHLPWHGPLRAVLRKIRDDEARHVAVTQAIALRNGETNKLRAAAAQLRHDLVVALTLAGNDFEALGIDPDRTLAAIAGLPTGLLRS
ncbi:hypothetical protein [Novosphingobium lentum]|uniref:hypothetical protein n=1 Tax=Novosphingobium lentum TaxID=145287 RepID=UPI0008331067|nr:hypothetical protein [Novosphingobium lentum]